MSKGISANVGESYQQAKASYVNVNGTWVSFGSLAEVRGFTSTTTYTVPAGCTLIDYVVVGGGGAGSSPDVNNAPGGTGGQVVATSNVSVKGGEKLIITIGAGGTTTVGAGASSLAGSFGTVKALGQAGAGSQTDGTYVPVWGWLGGGGAKSFRVPQQARISDKNPRGGGGSTSAAWGSIAASAQSGAPNTGGGGGAGSAPGGSGFVGIFVR